MSRPRIAVVVGTRPEVIKLAPVYRVLAEVGRFRPVLISTGQHGELLDGALRSFGLRLDDDLSLMSPEQTLNRVASQILSRLPAVLRTWSPAAVLVQGDTTSVFAAALAAYHERIPVGHVEAGLRTYRDGHPFPEEANRQLTDRISRWCFAPTRSARDNLIAERIDPGRIHITGNTGVDSLLETMRQANLNVAAEPFVLVTLHRRESLNGSLEGILLGLRDFLESTPEAAAVWPIHPNPRVSLVAHQLFANCERVRLVEPLAHVDFVATLARARLVLTDSGGIQEEAPSLGKRVLVARETTERPEALRANQTMLVGRDREGVRNALHAAWREPMSTVQVPAPNPFGDGEAGRRIAHILEADLRR